MDAKLARSETLATLTLGRTLTGIERTILRTFVRRCNPSAYLVTLYTRSIVSPR